MLELGALLCPFPLAPSAGFWALPAGLWAPPCLRLCWCWAHGGGRRQHGESAQLLPAAPPAFALGTSPKHHKAAKLSGRGTGGKRGHTETPCVVWENALALLGPCSPRHLALTTRGFLLQLAPALTSAARRGNLLISPDFVGRDLFPPEQGRDSAQAKWRQTGGKAPCSAPRVSAKHNCSVASCAHE